MAVAAVQTGSVYAVTLHFRDGLQGKVVKLLFLLNTCQPHSCPKQEVFNCCRERHLKIIFTLMALLTGCIYTYNVW